MKLIGEDRNNWSECKKCFEARFVELVDSKLENIFELPWQQNDIFRQTYNQIMLDEEDNLVNEDSELLDIRGCSDVVIRPELYEGSEDFVFKISQQ